MHIDLSELSIPQTYATLTQTIVPRPIAWILSENAGGNFNLAPFSYFNALASDPPMIVISVGIKPTGEEKDSRVNIRDRKDFVLHIAHREQAHAMTQTAATLAQGESELDGLDLTLTEMAGSRIPRIEQCRIAMACTLIEVKTVNTQELLFAEIKHLYLAEEVVGKDAKGRLKVHADRVDPLGRLGAGEYCTMGEIIVVERPK